MSEEASRVWTVPNIISLVRLAGVSLFLWLVLGPEADAIALVVLMVAGFTDYLDGWLARRLDQFSKLGEILDPVADRLYILAVVIGLYLRDIIPWWVALVLPLRDLLLSAGDLRRLVLELTEHAAVTDLGPLVALRHQLAERGALLALDDALRLMSLPRVVGTDPEGQEITAQNGRYGPYLKRGTDSRTLESEEQVFDITLAEALAIYAQPKTRRGATAKPPLRELGEDPVSSRPVVVKDGRFGEYVTDGEYNATLRKDDTVEDLTLERAAELLAERRARGPAKKAAKKGAKKAPAKKAAAKKTTAKKTAAKKTAKKAVKKTAKKAAKKRATKGAKKATRKSTARKRA